MSEITLQNDGDSFEKYYYELFIRKDFPSYEKFWLKFVVPLTNRPKDIHFKSNDELEELGLGDQEICISQLHYSIVRHLARVSDIKTMQPLNINGLTEGMVRLVGAQDIVFELLERFLNLSAYDPWLPVGERGSKSARQAWQRRENYPLQDIRNYRNNLVHGRITSSIIDKDCYVPKIGLENKYFDWRLVTDNPRVRELIGTDFIASNELLEGAWNQTIGYIEENWIHYLL